MAWVASKRSIVLPVAGTMTITAGFLAVQVPTEFDVKDFFTADSDFVVALDKVNEHFPEVGGEPVRARGSPSCLPRFRAPSGSSSLRLHPCRCLPATVC